MRYTRFLNNEEASYIHLNSIIVNGINHRKGAAGD